MHLSHGNQALHKVRCFFRVRLVNDSFVTLAGSSWFVCINSWNNQNFFLLLFLHFCKAGNIFTDRIFMVSRTWPDNQQKFVRFTCNNCADLCIANFFFVLSAPVSGVQFLKKALPERSLLFYNGNSFSHSPFASFSLSCILLFYGSVNCS